MRHVPARRVRSRLPGCSFGHHCRDRDRGRQPGLRVPERHRVDGRLGLPGAMLGTLLGVMVVTLLLALSGISATGIIAAAADPHASPGSLTSASRPPSEDR